MNPAKKNAGLSKDDLSTLKARLLEERLRILGDVSQLENEVLNAGDDVSVDHMADHGSDSYEQDQSLGLLERERKVLQDIVDALQRMEEGTYGICEKTGKKIGKARLNAVPYARLSLEAQMEAEAGS